MVSRHPLIEKIARPMAEHRAVPFLGAGCSIAHLGVDWTGLMVHLLGEEARSMDVLEAASRVVARDGRESFVAGLRDALLVDQFDDSKGSISMYIMGMSMGVLYTTNQDNVLERCFEKFGRKLNIVVELQDMGRQDPFFPTLYKYHGGLDVPESVVFTTEDYRARMSVREHHLDVRLRSDCLSKSLVFLGFSFADPNVRDLFTHLRKVFGGALPTSYLIQYQFDMKFAASLNKEFGIEVLDTAAVFPELSDPGERIDAFMKELNSAVVALRGADEIASLFAPPRGAGIRTASFTDIDALNETLRESAFEDAVNAFRSAYDWTLIPPSSEVTVAVQFSDLCRRASEAAHYESLTCALFNLRLQAPEAALQAWAACCAAASVASADTFFITAPRSSSTALPDEAIVVAVASAFGLLEEWGRKPTKAFYTAVSSWQARFPYPDDLPPKLASRIEGTFRPHYTANKTTYEQPFEYLRRVGRRTRPPSYQNILGKLANLMPRRARVPAND